MLDFLCILFFPVPLLFFQRHNKGKKTSKTCSGIFWQKRKTMERYEIVKDIGSGNFGVAKLVRDRWTKELFAVKFIERGHKVLSCLYPVSYFFFFSCFLIWFSVMILSLLWLCCLKGFLFCCRLMNMCKGKSWIIDHWNIPILLDSKRLVLFYIPWSFLVLFSYG